MSPSNSLNSSHFSKGKLKLGQSNHILIFTGPSVYIDFEPNWHTITNSFLRAFAPGIQTFKKTKRLEQSTIVNAEDGKKDVCGQKHERKNTISFFILRSGGRIYFLACTADTPFLWVSFPYVSCQAGVLMKQNDTGSLSLTLLHPPNTLVSASQERFSQPLLSPFFPRTRSDM